MNRSQQSAPVTSQGPLWSTLAGDRDMAELIEYFVSELPQRVAALADAAQQADLKALASHVHQIKGAAGGYGFEPITDLARKVEKLAREETDLTAVRQAVDELITLCSRARAGSPTA
ncbi:MAG: Hpt domain-containing protein [Phycisphaeraceae bacterium]|nr:Hpt domain-containing protein [Phycisphaeraceae bacterium]